jgi:MFS family permease
MYGLLFQLPQFFSVFRVTEPRDIGYMLFVMMIGMVVAAPLGGQLTDRIGARSAALLGSVLLLTGVGLLWGIDSFESPQGAMPALLMSGLGLGLCNAPAQSASMSAVEPGQVGMAAGVSSTMRYLGGILSILVLGAVLGDDQIVSVARHTVMIQLFTITIGLSALMSLWLPGATVATAKSP